MNMDSFDLIHSPDNTNIDDIIIPYSVFIMSQTI